MTPTQFFIIIASIFVALVAMPYITDYVFFVLDDERGWFGSSVGAAIIASTIIVVTTRIVGL
jgi:hypothetical protein